MTIYDDMRGYVHTHDRNGWFDVIAETTPMYQMIDKADAENVKLREVVEAILQCAGDIKRDKGCDACPMFNADGDFLVRDSWCRLYPTLRKLGIEVTDA